MKISGTGQVKTQTTKRTARAKSGDGAAFSRAVGDAGAPQPTSGTTAAGPITAVDALLTLQEGPDGSQGRSKGLARAQDMLAALEDVRRGLLLGAIPRAKLEALARLARTRREAFQDPRLTEILDEIELRAEVELAKLER